MLPKAHISASQLNTYLRCPAQYFFSYVQGIKIPPKSALTKGRAVHKGQEHNYSQKVETLTDRPLSEVREVTAAAFEAEQDATEFDPDEKPGNVKDEAVGLASLYHEQVAPTVQPVLVEEKVEVPLNNGVQLLGYIDLLDDKGFIRDTKTTRRTPPEGEIGKSLQLTAYSYAHRYLMGMPEAGVRLDYLVDTKTPKVVSLDAVRTEQDIARFLNITSRVIRAIENDNFYPNQTNFMCSEKNCGYWLLCHQTF